MSCTIEKILADARLLVNRLKDHDSCADSLISSTTVLHKRIDAMKQYEEDMNELNEMARHRPRANLILGLAQENSQIRELQQENKDLRMSLEEHQSAIELIMSKYREQIFKLVMANQLDKSKMVIDSPIEGFTDQDKIDKICEMAAVMRRAIEVDEHQSTQEQELISQLQFENRTLREILQISTESTVRPLVEEKDTQTNLSDSESENLNDSVIEVCDSSTIKRNPNSAKKQESSPARRTESPAKSEHSDTSSTCADTESKTDSEAKIDVGTNDVVKDVIENGPENSKKDENANSSTASA